MLERFSLRNVTSLALLYFILLATSAVSYEPTPGVWKEAEEALFILIFLPSLELLWKSCVLRKILSIACSAFYSLSLLFSRYLLTSSLCLDCRPCVLLA